VSTKGRILIVDDEASLAKVFARMLSAAGFQTELASNGREAAALIEKIGFDVILSDVSMPEMDGLSLIRLIRARDVDVPVILMTGAPSIESAARAVDLGAFRYLLKPVDTDSLLSAVDGAVRLHRIASAKREALDLLQGGGLGIGDRAAMECRFESALSSLWMAYQPIVSWSRRSIYGYEALVRSNESSLPHPGALFDAAERLGRVHELGSRIRDLAAGGFAAAPAGVQLFVNLHTLDLNEISLYQANAPLSLISKRVVLEITERASLDVVKNMRARMAILRKLGFRIAIDDLGAGYAGLTSFALLEPEVVKLDMSLIRDVHRELVKQRIVRSMISLCVESKLMVIAEGIETVEERDTIAGLGCDMMQGFLFARPERAFPIVNWE
jgi:EAL domain-containing protein (putative c-di-GMP-specific phosphodiesterase class I)